MKVKWSVVGTFSFGNVMSVIHPDDIVNIFMCLLSKANRFNFKVSESLVLRVTD